MGNPNASWFNPDKVIKDIIWNDLSKASRHAKGKLLDVGCGEKQYKKLFEKRVSSYIGLDPRSPFAEIPKSITSAHIPSSSFDTVLCTQVLEHVPDPEKVLGKIHRILKPKGVLILTVPFLFAIHEEPADFFRFSRFALEHMLPKAGFHMFSIKEEGNFAVSIGTLMAYNLEFSWNRYGLRYPKKILIAALLLITYVMATFPERFSKRTLCPMNYIVVAKKK